MSKLSFTSFLFIDRSRPILLVYCILLSSIFFLILLPTPTSALSISWSSSSVDFGSKPGLTSQEYVSTTTANISGATYGFTSSIDSSSDTCLRHSSIISQEDPLNPTPTNCTNTTTNYKIPLTNTISPTDSNNSTATLTLTSKATTSASNVAGEYSGAIVVTVVAKAQQPNTGD